MKKLLIFLAACAVDPPGLGHVYECRATFVCDGGRYTITPGHGCATDDEEALMLFRDRLADLVVGAQCNTQAFDDVACTPTREWCSI